MGFLDFLKKNNHDETIKTSEFKTMLVYDVIMIEIPKDWNMIENEKFKMVSKSKKINFVTTIFDKELDPNNKFTIEKLENDTIPLFDKFVNEGGYEPIDDREIGSGFVYQAFKVDEETQYYYFTSREGKGMLLRIYFILKEKGAYNRQTKDLLLKIGQSIIHRVA